MSENNTAAIVRYQAHRAKSLKLIADLQDLMLPTVPNREVDWGNVGDAHRDRAALQEIHDRLTGSGEYAASEAPTATAGAWDEEITGRGDG